MLRRIVLALLTIVAATSANGQANGTPCDGLLQDGLKNVTRRFEEDTLRRAAHKKHCKQQNESWSFKDDASFTWFFHATASPDFSQSSGEQWCKENASALATDSLDYLEVLTFSNEALSAFNTCMQLQKENVLVDAKIENDVLIVSVWRNSGRESWIQRFSYEPKLLSCDATGQSESGVATKHDLAKAIPLVQDFKVNIICRRLAQQSEAEEEDLLWPRTTVALTTDLSSPLAITLREQALAGRETVAELRDQIQRIEETLSRRVIPANITSVEVQTSFDAGHNKGKLGPNDTRYEEVERDLCVGARTSFYAGRTASCTLTRQSARSWRLTAGRTAQGTVGCIATCFDLQLDGTDS